MTRVRLKGLNKKTVRLASGETVTYWYAWKGGPRLPGKPGSISFMDAYNEAIKSKREKTIDTLQSLLDAFQKSRDFTGKRERTRRDYIAKIAVIEAEFGDFPLSALGDKRTRHEFLAWRDTLAEKSLRQADYAWQVLSRILSWAKHRGIISENPCERGGRLYEGDRADKVWSAADEAAFLKVASKELKLAFMMALWTGQRRGDLVNLDWSAYDGQKIRLQQSKTKVRVEIPVGAPLKALLDPLRQTKGPILVNSRGEPWSGGGLGIMIKKARVKAGVTGVTFNDLRGTAITRLAVAGCTEAEIATISGHSLRDVRSILDSNYLHRDHRLGESAIKKLEISEGKSPNGFPNAEKPDTVDE
jgi:integrase